MSRSESIAVGFAVGILCPVSLLILLWWTTAALAMYHVLPIKVSVIATAAFTGLGIGILFDILFLKNWIAGFYNANTKFMVPAYLFWSVVAVAFCMGLPLGNLALGTLAGLYVGRRQYHANESKAHFTKAARNVSIFTALVTSAEALPIGLLALEHERHIAEMLLTVMGLGQSDATGPAGVGLIVLLCVVLMVVQFWCTRIAAALAFRSSRNVVQ